MSAHFNPSRAFLVSIAICSVTECVRPATVLATCAVYAISPAAGPVAGHDQFTITGSGFIPGTSRVLFGGSYGDENLLVVNSTTIVAKSPPAGGPGTVTLTVNSGSNGSCVLVDGYKYIGPLTFTDGGATGPSVGTSVKAQHFTELRQAIDMVRVVGGRPTLQWTDSTLTPGGTPVRASHMVELRGRLEDGLLGHYPEMNYTDGTLLAASVPIRAVHVQEIRTRLSQVGPYCTYTVSQPAFTIPPDNGQTGLSLTTGSACKWRVTSAVDWIWTDAQDNYQGNGTFTLYFGANPGNYERRGTVWVGDQRISVTQGAEQQAAAARVPPRRRRRL